MAVTWEKLIYNKDAVRHDLATAASDFLVASGAGVFVKKTLAETKTLLGMTDTASLDPGHKHSALWANDGSPQAVWVDTSGQVGIGCIPVVPLTLPANGTIGVPTTSGSDNAGLFISGAGAWDSARGACLEFYGINHATKPGVCNFTSGMDIVNWNKGSINFITNGWRGMTVAAVPPWGVTIWKQWDALGTFFDYATGNVGIGASAWGTSAAGVLGIGTGTAPSTAPADMIQIYSTDISAGHCCFAVFQEYAPYAGAAVASTHKIPVKWNGTTYYILATTVA